MVSTKWFQGVENKNNYMEIRKKVFCEELNFNEELISDFYDQFAFNAVVYEDDIPAGTGRLLFKEGKYFLDNICVIDKFRGKKYGNLLIRMLVRKAINIGAEKTYVNIDKKYVRFFEEIGFKEINNDGSNVLMMKIGDVGGHCAKN